MYKLIFADDEEIMRGNISTMIHWRQHGFDLVGVCANGHDLVEMAEREQPDFVILDINMPYIDGIAAAKRIKEEVPNVKLAFLTGYDKFSYAQKAVDLNVLKYILKPVTAAAMSDILAEIRCILDAEKRAEAGYRQLKDFYDRNYGLLRSAFFDMLLEGLLTESEAAEKITALELDMLSEGPYLSAIILSDRAQGESVNESAANLLNCGIYNIAEETLVQNRLGIAGMKGDRTVIVFCRQKNSDEPFSLRIMACLDRIRRSVQASLNITVSIGVGKEYADYGGISRSYTDAVSALAYRYTLGGNRVILISDIEPNRQPVKVFDRLQETRLIDAIKSGNLALINELTEYMFLSSKTEDIHILRVYAMSIMVSVALEAERLGFSADLRLLGAGIDAFFRGESAESLFRDVREACLSLSRLIGSQQHNSQRSIFEKAVHIIEERIADAELSVDVICGELHFSPSYFRALFKKEAGVSFGAYLTQIRMKKARQLLLETDQKGYLIAKQVGFSDPHYFSFCFKKYFRMSPKEMREGSRDA